MINMTQWLCTYTLSKHNYALMIKKHNLSVRKYLRYGWNEIIVLIMHLGYFVQHITGKCSVTLCITQKIWEVMLQYWTDNYIKRVSFTAGTKMQAHFPVSLQWECSHVGLQYCALIPLSHYLLKSRKTCPILEYFFFGQNALDWQSSFQTQLSGELAAKASWADVL